MLSSDLSMFGSFKLPHLRRKANDDDCCADKPPKTPVASPKEKRHNRHIKRNSESDTCPSIASLRPGSVALTSDQLTPGDRIHSVNGINTSRMRADEVTTLLDNIDGNALLEIEYCLPSYSSQSSLCVASKVAEVTVERSEGSLGITLRGGFVPDHPHLSRPLVITQVRPDGPAYNTGLIRVGDRLLKVDNYNLTNKTLLEAQKILKDSSVMSVSSLTIEYDVSIMESVKYATGPLLVEIDRTGNEDLGLLLGPADADAAGGGVHIDHIIPASTADRCGALNAGDQLLAVDDVDLLDWAGGGGGVGVVPADVERHLKCATRIQIMPAYALQRVASARSYGIGTGAYGSSPTVSGFSTLNSKRSRSTRSNAARNNNRHSSVSRSLEDTASAYSGSAYSTNHGVCHSETLAVTLIAERGKGYGLSVGVAANDTCGEIIITRVAPDSAAYRCGCLQQGDRIVAINHRGQLTLQEINALLEMAVDASTSTPTTGKLHLQIEFDVADSIVPSSGIFTVKLARGRGPGLGITITAARSHPEEPFIVSEIRRGSVAHRTGTLHAGDRLLAIDNRQLDHLSVESAFDILQASTNEIVTLKVEKNEGQQCADAVVYTVELLRHGGPLGVTIAGSEDCSESIVISRLTEGGLAEKTGALHVGDQLIAINGEALEQKPLSEAIRLLQTSGDRVQLKIARSLKTEVDEARCSYSSPGVTSIDSAVHSWDSNPPESGESAHAEIKDFESVLSEPLSYQDSKHDSQLQFYSDADDIFCPSPLPLPNYNLGLKYESRPVYTHQHSLHQYAPARCDYMERFPSDNMLDTEVCHVTLYKDSVYDDYGFSVSDGLYEKGVYINRIRKGGPADIVGMLKPYDRIIQVNDTKTQEFDCCLTVPLIASAGDRIDLVIARNPYVMLNAIGGSYDVLSRKSFSASNNTITKTL